MKIAKITPIYEKGDEKKCNNHRPIAILPISSEVIELAIKKKIGAILEIMELFSAYQHIYSKSRNTTTAIQSALNTIMKALKEMKRYL